MRGGFFGNAFDVDHNGELDFVERAMDMMAFADMVAEDSSGREEAVDNLASMGINVDDMSVTDINAILDDHEYGGD